VLVLINARIKVSKSFLCWCLFGKLERHFQNKILTSC
jgi:hypothetical protein